MAELGPLVPQDVLLEGSSWKESSVDIAIAGDMNRSDGLRQLCFSVIVCMGLGCHVPLDYWSCWGNCVCDCAGLGWLAVGVKGPADLRVWVHQGVSITTHASILPDYARDLERPGFSQSNIKV